MDFGPTYDFDRNPVVGQRSWIPLGNWGMLCCHATAVWMKINKSAGHILGFWLENCQKSLWSFANVITVSVSFITIKLFQAQPTLRFLQPGYCSCHPNNSVKAIKVVCIIFISYFILMTFVIYFIFDSDAPCIVNVLLLLLCYWIVERRTVKIQ